MQKDIFKKILIIRTDHIGDMLVTTPVIRAIHKKYPCARIDVVASTAQAVALENNIYVGTIHIYEKKSLLKFLPFIFKIRKEKYHTVLVINAASSTACTIMRFCKAENRIGILCPAKHKKYFTQTLDVTPASHIIHGYLEAIASLEIPSDSHKMDYFLSQENRELIKKEYPTPENTYRFALFIGNIKKPHVCWPTENFVELIKKLIHNKNMEFYIFGGNAEKKCLPLFETVSKQHSNLHFFMGENFQKGAAFLSTCHALISCSSGPAHLASAIGTPVLSILYEYNYTYWRPLGEKDLEVCPKPPLHQISDNSIEDVLNMAYIFMEKEHIPYIK